MIVCWFSCGAASACATKLAIEKYGKNNVRVVNNPVANEHEDNRRFLHDCERWLGITIEPAINSCFPDCDITKVFEEYGLVSTPHFAPCTLELKQMARMQWEKDNNFDREKDTIVMGYTVEEKNREATRTKGIDMIQHICVNVLAIIGVMFVAIMAAIVIYGFWKITREL